MFHREYFADLSKRAEEFSQKLNRLSGKPLYIAAPRVEIHLADGTKHILRMLEDTPGEGVLTFLAYQESGAPDIVISVPYEAIAQVDISDAKNERERVVGFQISTDKEEQRRD